MVRVAAFFDSQWILQTLQIIITEAKYLHRNISENGRPFPRETPTVDAEQMLKNCMSFQFSEPEKIWQSQHLNIITNYNELENNNIFIKNS